MTEPCEPGQPEISDELVEAFAMAALAVKFPTYEQEDLRRFVDRLVDPDATRAGLAAVWPLFCQQWDAERGDDYPYPEAGEPLSTAPEAPPGLTDRELAWLEEGLRD